MTAKRIPYTVLPHAAGKSACAVCGAKFAEGEAAVSVWNHPHGLSWHAHAACDAAEPAAPAAGPSPADQLMADIRAGKPPANPPAQLATRIQGGRRL